MSKLISGKEALIALANGEEVQHFNKKMATFGNLVKDEEWGCCDELTISDFNSDLWAFRLKPRTITINGIEVPAPIKGRPVDGEIYFILSGTNTGYTSSAYTVPSLDGQYIDLYGYWENEEEIKQVVEALRKVFEVQP